MFVPRGGGGALAVQEAGAHACDWCRARNGGSGGGACLSAGGGACLSAGGGACLSAGGGACLSAGGGACLSAGGGACLSAGGGACLSAGGGACLSAGGGACLSAGGGACLSAGGGACLSAGGGACLSAGGGACLSAGGGACLSAGGGACLSAGGGACLSAEKVEFSSASRLWLLYFTERAINQHREVGELKKMDEFNLMWLPQAYLKTHTKHTEIHEAWDKLPLEVRNDEEMQTYRLCEEHWNLPESRVHIDGPAPRIRNCNECGGACLSAGGGACLSGGGGASAGGGACLSAGGGACLSAGGGACLSAGGGACLSAGERSSGGACLSAGEGPGRGSSEGACLSAEKVEFSSASRLWLLYFTERAINQHREVGELKKMDEFNLMWLPQAYLKTHTKHTEIHEAWDKLPLEVRNDEEMQTYRLCEEHWNLPESRVHIDGPAPRIRNCNECKLKLKLR
ncbi:hypothetical protein FQR65_LT15985 [Abscondita terminalis]|nr:hypothetical protein FQR65_LT15985 [Abscondita terminalis]